MRTTGMWVALAAAIAGAPAAAQTKVYVANQGSNTVSVIDANPDSPTFNTVLSNPTVGAGPARLNISRNGAWVYVTNRGQNPNTISVIDTATDSVDPVPIPAGTGPSGRAVFRPDSAFAYVANQGSNNITVIDTAMRSFVTNLNAGTRPIGLIGRGCPTGPYRVVFNQGSNNVTIVDVTMNVVVGTVPVGGQPVDGLFRPDCAFFFVATAANTVVPIDMTTFAALTPVTVGNSPSTVTIRPDGAFLYVTNQGSNDVSVLDATASPFPEVVRPAVGTAPVDAELRPDGAFLFVVNQGSNDVSVIDTAANSVVGDVAVGVAPSNGLMSPDGALFAVINGSSLDITVIDPTSVPFTAVATLFVGFDDDPATNYDVSPDGKVIYMSNPVSNTVLRVDLLNLVVSDPISVGNRPTDLVVTQF